MDIAIPTRKNRPSPDHLKWVLRSIYHHMKHDRVFIVGEIPVWLAQSNVVCIPTDQTGTKHVNQGINLAAMMDSDISEDFYYWDDDIFIMRDTESIPLYARGMYTAAEFLDSRYPAGNDESKAYTQGLRDQLTLLQQWGFDLNTLYFTDLHAPIPLNKARLKDVLERRNVEAPHIEGGQFQALYGAGLPCIPVRDFKIRRATDLPDPSNHFVSLSPNAWKGATGKYLKMRYWHPSPYELA